MLLTIIFYFVVFYVIYFVFLKSDPVPTSGVYSQTGKWFWLKYAIFRLLYYVRKRQKERLGTTQASDGSVGYGVKSKSNIEQMEIIQPLSEQYPKAVDAVYFNGSNSSGFYLVAAIARRHQNINQTVFILHVPSVGMLQLPCAPATTIVTSESINGYRAGGLQIEMLSPMKKWKLSFRGDMVLDGNLVPVVLNAVWERCSDYFDADTDMDEHALAMSIAREPWSRAFFERLKSSHQTHYEQFGDFRGTAKVGGVEYSLNLRGARDHSYGNEREWKHFHRYALQFVHLDNGICFNVGVLSMPNITMSRLEFGYVFLKNGGKQAVEWCDIDMSNLGECPAQPPDVYEFKFSAGNEIYQVQCEVVHRPVFYLGQDWEAKVYEQMCRYIVNGVKGYGFSEWEYRHLGPEGVL